MNVHIPISRDVEICCSIPITYSRPMYQLIRWYKPVGVDYKLAQLMRTCGTLKQAVHAAKGLTYAPQNWITIIKVKNYMSAGNPDVLAEYDLQGNQTF